MNRFGKVVFVLTAIGPIFGAYAVIAGVNREWWPAGIFAAVGGTLMAICLAWVREMPHELAVLTVKTKKVKPADKEAMAFLLVYLLPLFSRDAVPNVASIWVPVYVIAILTLVVYHSNAFTFNPVLAARGYHFYEVETEAGMIYTVISKQVLSKNDNDLSVVKVTDYVYLDASKE